MPQLCHPKTSEPSTSGQPARQLRQACRNKKFKTSCTRPGNVLPARPGTARGKLETRAKEGAGLKSPQFPTSKAPGKFPAGFGCPHPPTPLSQQLTVCLQLWPRLEKSAASSNLNCFLTSVLLMFIPPRTTYSNLYQLRGTGLDTVEIR